MSQVLKIYGPPGTGKTHRLLQLFEEELKHLSPERIAFLTFTRAAKKEALERSDKQQGDLPFLRTLHSVCYRQLGIQPGQMVRKKDLRYFGKLIGVQFSGVAKDPWAEEEWDSEEHNSTMTQADALLHINHLGRHRKVNLYDMLDSSVDVDVPYAKWFTSAYRDWKYHESMLDYTDLLVRYIVVGEPLPIDVMLVDEAQDLSALQWDVVHKLGASAERTYLAGDDDQAIFSWAGASAEAFNLEPATETEFLVQSKRLPRQVLTKSQEIIHRVQSRIEKPTQSRDAEGSFEEGCYLDPALFAADSFLLFRNHFRGKALASQLEEQAIPFSGCHAILELEEVQAALRGWLAASRGDLLTAASARAVQAFSDLRVVKGESSFDKQGEVPITAVLKHTPTEKEWPSILTRLPRIGYISRCLKEHGFERVLKPTVALKSIHQVKGQEASTVVIDPVMARRSFDAMYADEDSEHRVWYTAVTRAKEAVKVLAPEEALCYEL